MCEKVKKPPKDHKNILRKLFPSSSSPSTSNSESSKSSIPVFDPSNDCIFVKEQKAKKKATKSKSAPRLKLTNVTLMVVQDVQKGVPRGVYKESLIKKGMAMRIKLHREMSESEVQAKMRKILQPYFSDYTILDCDGIKLIPRHNHPSGAELIESAMKRRGNTIYVTKKIATESSDSSEVSFILGLFFILLGM